MGQSVALTENQRTALSEAATLYDSANYNPHLLLKLAQLYKERGNKLLFHSEVDANYFAPLEKDLLISKGQLILEKNKLKLSAMGYWLCEELGEHGMVQPKYPVGQSLQNTVRGVRTWWDSWHIPTFNKFWWWNLRWRLRNWWSETNPAPRPLIDMGELVPHQVWTEADEARNFRMWKESHYGAFWLCPGGVIAGLEALKDWDREVEKHGPQLGACIDAVVAIAKMASQLPEPKAVLQAKREAELAEKVRLKKLEQEKNYKNFQTLVTVNKSMVKNHASIRMETYVDPSDGKTYAKPAIIEPFIFCDDDSVEAIPSAIEEANKAADRAIDALNTKPIKPKKPRLITLAEQFERAYSEVQEKEAASIRGRCIDPDTLTPEQLKNLQQIEGYQAALTAKPKRSRPSKK